MTSPYPITGFSFSVSLHGLPDGPDSAFTEVSGLEVERDEVTVKEGGENRFLHRLPGHAKSGNLVLKRGIVPGASALRAWLDQNLESDLGTPIKPVDLDISLLDPDHKPVMAWSVERAWPIRAEYGPFDATQNTFAVETLTLAHTALRRNLGREAVGLSLGAFL